MSIINCPPTTLARAPDACRAVHKRSRQIAVKPIAVESYLQAMPDQARGCAVDAAIHRKCARACHASFVLNEVGRTMLRQLLHVSALHLERGSITSVAAHHHAAHKLLVRWPIIEIAMTAQLQRLIDRVLQVAMRGLHAAVLVAQAT